MRFFFNTKKYSGFLPFYYDGYNAHKVKKDQRYVNVFARQERKLAITGLSIIKWQTSCAIINTLPMRSEPFCFSNKASSGVLCK